MALGLLILNAVTVQQVVASGEGELSHVLERVAPGLLASALFILILLRLGRRMTELKLEVGDDGIKWTDHQGVRVLAWDDLQRVRLRGYRICLEGRDSRLSLPLFKVIPSMGLLDSDDPRALLLPFLETLRERAPQAHWYPSLEEWIPGP